jgi:iron complex outermembrane recepter protein
MRWSWWVCLVAGAALAHENDGGTVYQSIVHGTAARPAQQVTVRSDVIRAAPRAGATDLLRLVPGLVASQHSGEGKAQQLFLRGFDAVHGQDVELSVAGLPVNEPSHIHALGYADLNWLIPEVVREVRVTEGSSRAWQGDFAVAGTVRYELGLSEEGVSLAAGYGSYNRWRLFAGARPPGYPDTFLAAEYIQGAGFGAQRAFGRFSLLGQGALSVGAVKLRAVVGSAAGRFDSPGVVRLDAFERGEAAFFDAFGAGQGGTSSRHQLLLGAELNHSLGRTQVELFGQALDLRLRNNFTGFVADGREGDGLEQVQSDVVVGIRANHRVLTSWGSFEVGVTARRDGIAQTQRRYRDVDGAPLEAQVASTIGQTHGALWLEAWWQPGEWLFMLGGRLDVLQVEVFDQLAFRGTGTTRSALGAHPALKATVERQLGHHLRAFLAYGDGFRTPQARQLSNGEQAPFVTVRSADLGLVGSWQWLQLRLVAFGSFVGNDFFFEHTVGTTVFTGSTLRGGGLGQVVVRPVEGLVMSAGLTAATARVLSTNSLLPYFAPVVGRLDVGWEQPFRVGSQSFSTRLGVGLTALGPRPLPFGDFSNAVVLVDARAAVRFRAVELTLDVQNLFDARWRDGEFVYASAWARQGQASQLPSRHFSAGMPRTLFTTLELHL